MNEKVKQIFGILGVEPEEEFKFRNGNPVIYKFDNDMNLLFKLSKGWKLSDLDFSYVVKTKIEKISQKPKLTNKDKISIKFLKNCGFHYVVYEKNNFFYIFRVFENEPEKNTTAAGDIVWIGYGADHYFPANIFDMLIDYKEPLCLDNFSDEDLKED